MRRGSPCDMPMMGTVQLAAVSPASCLHSAREAWRQLVQAAPAGPSAHSKPLTAGHHSWWGAWCDKPHLPRAPRRILPLKGGKWPRLAVPCNLPFSADPSSRRLSDFPSSAALTDPHVLQETQGHGAGPPITGPRLQLAGHQAPQGRPCPPRAQGSCHMGVGWGRVGGPICPQAEWWLCCGSPVGSFGTRWVRSENNSCGNKCCVQPARLPNFRETVFLSESWSRRAADRHPCPANNHGPTSRLLARGLHLAQVCSLHPSAPEVRRPAGKGGVGDRAETDSSRRQRVAGRLTLSTAHTLKVCFPGPIETRFSAM